MLTTEIDLLSGKIRGVPRTASGVLAFKGIPYAAPPVGALRWRPPQEVLPWNGVHDATAFGPPCFAAPVPGLEKMTIGQDEDCLTLNVWTSAESAGEKRPVMVWIHGGGFEFGSSAFPITEGHVLATKGVVVVSMNYRLGIFGFLAHSELDREGTPSGNYGLQDQIAALEWVRRHIALFGGNPDNVTIFGESAGAHAVGLLMASPLAKGLFHKAIGQSGAFWESEHGSLSTKAEAQARGEKFMARLNAGDIAALRAMKGERLNRLSAWNFLEDPGVTAFSPNIDEFVVPDSPAKLFAEGRQNDVPLLAGWNDAEHSLFAARALPHRRPKAFRQAAAAQFGAARLEEFLSAYPAGSVAEAKGSAERLAGDLIISQQTWEWLGLQHRTGASAVYGYNFGYRSAYSPQAGHIAEIPFVFGILAPAKFGPPSKPAGSEDREFSALMMSYWVAFAGTGDPNRPGLPRWPAYQGAGSAVMRFDKVSSAVPEDGTMGFRFIQSFRRDGRLPESWRKLRGGPPAAVLRLLSKAIIMLVRFRGYLSREDA